MTRSFLMIAAVLGLVNCGDNLPLEVFTPPGAPVAPEANTCTDPRYEDSRCDYRPLCGAPDPACLEIYDTPEAAARATPDYVLAQRSSATWERAQRLFDQAWSLWKQYSPFPLYALANRQPLLVVLEASQVNAFVLPGPFLKTAYAVYVSTGLIDSLSDAAIVGVFAHELSHVLRLQADVRVQPLQDIYFAEPAAEPLGGLAVAQQHITAKERAAFAELQRFRETFGTEFTNPDYDALPIDIETLIEVFDSNADTPACGQQFNGFLEIVRNFLGALYLGVPTDTATVLPAARASFEELAACLPAGTMSRMRNGRMAAAARRVEISNALGRNLDLLRFYSDEDSADDDAALVLRSAGIPATVMGPSLTAPFDAACEAELRRGAIPSFGPLTKPHHTGCFRWHHFYQLEEQNAVVKRPFELRAQAEARWPEALGEPRRQVAIPDEAWRAGPTTTNKRHLIKL